MIVPGSPAIKKEEEISDVNLNTQTSIGINFVQADVCNDIDIKPNIAEETYNLVNSSNECTDSDDDPVVKTLKVYMTKPSENEVHLIQFPTFDFKKGKNYVPVSAKMKMQSGILELEHELVTDPKYYDDKKAAKLISHYDKNNSGGQNVTDKMSRLALQSTKFSYHGKDYIGILNNDELQLIPIHEISQLRPNIRYMDIMDEKMEELTVKEQLDDNNEDPNYEEPSKILTLSVEPSDETQSNLMKLTHLAQEIESEAWTPLDISFCHSKDEIIDALYTSTDTSVDISNHSFSKNLLSLESQLSPDIINYKSVTPFDIPPECSVSICNRLYPNVAIKYYMCKVKLTNFDTLKDVIKIENDEIILNILSECATLVHGIWITNSELAYKGLPMLCRKWLIYLFMTSSYVNRAKFSAECKLPFEVSTNMIKEIAYFVPKMGWRLKLHEDINFCKRYPQLVSTHHAKIKKEGLESISIINNKFVNKT